MALSLIQVSALCTSWDKYRSLDNRRALDTMTSSPNAEVFVWCTGSAAGHIIKIVTILVHSILKHTKTGMGFLSGEDIMALATAARFLLTTFYYSQNFWFITLFLWRYLRLIVHMISFWLYKPILIPMHPTILRSDCTVIIPIADPDPEDSKLKECLRTVLANNPAAIIVTTVGKDSLACCKSICAPLNAANGNKIRVIQQSKGNKRVQVCHAMPYVKTRVVVGVDATVFWPSTQFLPAILAPFENPEVGVVGTYKRVVREPRGINFKSFWNFIGCLYLERHNFEVAATSNIDGGVFVISGRTAAYRTEIFTDPDFQQGFINERFFFGLFGPLNPDDDNFITRWVVRQGWKVKFQYSDDAMIQTRVGTYPRYLSQCLRWVRTTWRSNSASLFTDPTRTKFGNWVWIKQPWCVYAVYLSSFTNFALFIDLWLLYLVSTTTFADAYGWSFVMKCMGVWTFASKLVKPLPHFRRHPADLLFLPGYILFGYYHSLLKLYALFTFWNCAWSGRKVEDAETDETPDDEGAESEYFPPSTDTLKDEDGFIFHGRTPKNTSVACQNVEAGRSGIVPASNIIQTPWGAAKTSAPHLIPTNVLEPQIPGIIGTLRGGEGPSEPIRGKSGTFICKSKIPCKLYTWTRGSNCERLHSEDYNPMPVRQRCVLGTPSGYTGTPRA